MKPQETNPCFKCRTSLKAGECDCNDRCLGCTSAETGLKCHEICGGQNPNQSEFLCKPPAEGSI